MSLADEAGLLEKYGDILEEDTSPEPVETPVEEEEEVAEPEADPAPSDQPEEPSLSDALREFGMSQVDPESLDEGTKELVLSMAQHGNKRIRGLQAGSTKAVQEAAEGKAKAEAYDALVSTPAFLQWFDDYRNGRTPSAKETSPWDDIDPDKLPSDPFERFKVISAAAAREALQGELQQLRQELGLVKEHTAKSAWTNFMSQNEDLKPYETEVRDLISRGITAIEAAEVVRNRHFDVDAAVEAKLLELRTKQAAKKKAGGTLTRTRTSSSGKSPTDKERKDMKASDYLSLVMERAAAEAGF